MSRGNSSSDRIEIGTVLELGGNLSVGGNRITRRRFLKALGLAGTGIIGFKNAIEMAYGKEVEGVPLVLTDDIYGNPDRVRTVSEERYRRLQVAGNINIASIQQENPAITAVGVTQRSESEHDLALELYLNEDLQYKQRDLLDSIENVPVEYTSESIEVVEEAHSGINVCDRRHDQFDTMRGGLAIGPGPSIQNGDPWGTLGLVGFDNFSNKKVLITADHVISADQHTASDYIYQPDYNHPNAQKVGNLNRRDPNGMDVASFNLRSGVDGSPRVTHRNDVPDITGTWNYYGLANETNPGTVFDCKLTGARTCLIRDNCIDAVKIHQTSYLALMEHHLTDGGDSGAPWVDPNGKLLAIHRGAVETNNGYKSAGGIGRHALNNVEMSLSR